MIKKICLTFILSLIVWSSLSGQVVFAQDYPARPIDYVSDFANQISPTDEQIINQYARELQRKTSVELSVVTVKSTQPLEIDQYANILFEKWGIGKKGKDNGILMLLAVKDRTTRTEVGYGLEGVITDAISGRIQREVMIPRFKAGGYSKGMKDGAVAVISLIAQDQGVTITGQESYYATSLQKSGSPASKFIKFIFYCIMLMIIFTSRTGLLGCLLFGSMYNRHRRRGYWGNSYGGFGGGLSGGGFSGGFGGFGGGMSGGGGSSGSW
ncbi:MAG: TPM domain-containing protein [Candidatus Omnitrophica bacterium]|nr:TPM domain-containing protein [Candidatus Omnitrophota bacterium]